MHPFETFQLIGWDKSYWRRNPYERDGVNHAYLWRRCGNAFSGFVIAHLISAVLCAMRSFPEEESPRASISLSSTTSDPSDDSDSD